MEPTKVVGALAERVLIKPALNSADVLKVCYDLAGRLRERGYVVELELRPLDDAGYSWIIGGGKDFSVIDKYSGKEYKGLSIADVLQRLEAAQ